MIKDLTQDLRYAFRMLTKSPVYAVVSIITLALGISACVTIFALIDSVLLRSYASYSERSVVIRHTRPPDTTPLNVLPARWSAFSSEFKSFELLNARWENKSMASRVCYCFGPPSGSARFRSALPSAPVAHGSSVSC